MVKGYIAGTRKEHNRQARIEEEEHSGGRATKTETAGVHSKKKRPSADLDTDLDESNKLHSKRLKTGQSSTWASSNLDVDEIPPRNQKKPTTTTSNIKSKKRPRSNSSNNEFSEDSTGPLKKQNRQPQQCSSQKMDSVARQPSEDDSDIDAHWQGDDNEPDAGDDIEDDDDEKCS